MFDGKLSERVRMQRCMQVCPHVCVLVDVASAKQHARVDTLRGMACTNHRIALQEVKWCNRLDQHDKLLLAHRIHRSLIYPIRHRTEIPVHTSLLAAFRSLQCRGIWYKTICQEI